VIGTPHRRRRSCTRRGAADGIAMEKEVTTDIPSAPPRSAVPGRAWLGAPVRTLRQPAFDAACAELRRLVEADYAPSLIVGIRTGGLIVARSMVGGVSAPLPVLPLTCRRPATGVKSRLPLLRALLTGLPQPTTDLLRRVEHRLATASRAVRAAQGQAPDAAQPPQIAHAEAEAIAGWIARSSEPARILVADDAVDSGATLAAVLQRLRELCPPATEIRSAAITQTFDHPIVSPDYALYRDTLCRFPWSFDAKAA
jgi:uncharacterized protein